MSHILLAHHNSVIVLLTINSERDTNHFSLATNSFRLLRGHSNSKRSNERKAIKKFIFFFLAPFFSQNSKHFSDNIFDFNTAIARNEQTIHNWKIDEDEMA